MGWDSVGMGQAHSPPWQQEPIDGDPAGFPPSFSGIFLLGLKFKKEKIYIRPSFLRPVWQSLICPSHSCYGSRKPKQKAGGIWGSGVFLAAVLWRTLHAGHG